MVFIVLCQCVLFQKKSRLVSVRWICVAWMNRAAHADDSHILHIVSRVILHLYDPHKYTSTHCMLCIVKEIKVKAFCVRVMCLITTCDFICNFCHHHNAHMKWKNKMRTKKNKHEKKRTVGRRPMHTWHKHCVLTAYCLFT